MQHQPPTPQTLRRVEHLGLLPGFQFPTEATNITIGQDGTVSFVRPPNPTPEQLQQIELADVARLREIAPGDAAQMRAEIGRPAKVI